jgi:PAS domain S-box-containing protein
VPEYIETPEDSADFESLIADLSSRFIGLAPAEVDREINDLLRRICAWFEIDFAVLWQWSDESPNVIVPTHYHYSEAGQHPPEKLDGSQYPWYRQQMQNGRVFAIASLDDLPPEAAVDREHGRQLGIRSSLCIPLALGGEPPVGALALNLLREERSWPAAVIKRARLISQFIATALARQRTYRALREAEERLNMAVEAAGAGLWSFDERADTVWASPRAREMFGYTPDEVISLRRFEASVHPDDRPLVMDALEQSQRTGEPLDVEYRIVVPGEAAVRWIAARGRWVPASGAGSQNLMGISLDVSERRHLAEEARANNARLLAGAELAGLGFYETDYRTGVMQGDARFHELLGIMAGPGDYMEYTRQWAERLHPEDRPAVLRLRERLHSGEVERIAIEYRYLHPARDEIWIDHLAAAVERDASGRLLRNIGVVRDIGHLKQAELGLRQMSQRLLHAQEQERALIARELHDDLSQRLAVLAIEAARAEGAVGPEGSATLRSVREELVRVSEDVHTLAYQLHPSVLEELGLAEALRAECEHRSRQSGLDLSLSIDPPPDGLDNETALCLFRVAQEALSNAIRHSGSHRLQVQLRRQDGGVLLAVRDDGIGFDLHQSANRRHLGLESMRERMRMVGGTLDVDSAPASGTTVVAWVPVAGGAP